MRKKLFTLCLLILLTSCSSNELTKADAETIIKANYPTFCKARKVIDSYNTFNGKVEKKRKPLLPVLENLKNQGLITVSFEQKSLGLGLHTIKTTQKANDLGYGGKQFGIAQNDVVEIIGISQTENEATVRVKLKRTETPFYELHRLYYYGMNTSYLRCEATEYEKDFSLVRFDDGWKLK